jgi:hypothetical protein
LPALLNYTSGLPPSIEALDIRPELPTPYTAGGMLGYLGMTTLQPKDIGTAYTYSNLAFSILAQILPMFRTNAALPAPNLGSPGKQVFSLLLIAIA